MIECRLAAGSVRLGESLRGRVEVRPSEAARAPRELRIEVGWRTEGRGSVNASTVHSLRVPPPEGWQAGWSQPFEAAIPKAGPVSYDGRLIRVLWEVRVVLDLPWASDETHVTPFDVVVGGRP